VKLTAKYLPDFNRTAPSFILRSYDLTNPRNAPSLTLKEVKQVHRFDMFVSFHLISSHRIPSRSNYGCGFGLASAAILSPDACSAAAVPSLTPPVHLPSLRSQATVPKLVVRRTFARRADSLSHFFVRASMSVAEGKVFPTTLDLGFWTCLFRMISIRPRPKGKERRGLGSHQGNSPP
jgi:hypothetical protein